MTRGTHLSEIEKRKILDFRSSGLSLRTIGRRISRSDHVVRNFLKDPESYGTKIIPGRPQKLTRRDKRRLSNAASNSVNSLLKFRAPDHFSCFKKQWSDCSGQNGASSKSNSRQQTKKIGIHPPKHESGLENRAVSQSKNNPPTILQSQDTVFNLLSSWDLPELASKFKFHEIDYRAMLCLTEKDICELIPKIGRRAIFRSSLIEWRRKNLNSSRKRRASPELPLRITSTRAASPIIHNDENQNNQQQQQNNNSQTEMPDIKNEQIHSDYESEDVQNEHNMQNNNNDDIANNRVLGMETADEDEDDESRPSSSETPEARKFSASVMPTILTKKSSSDFHVDVNDILTRCPEGRQIIAYYEVNGGFDYSHRRRLVSVIINEVVRKNRWLAQDDFARISNDIIQMFPREEMATYYTARNGLKNPKGCLYNKFLNLTRKLRQEGILQYRNNVQLQPERVSARHYGEVKSYKNNY